jgi:hypothetical protein
MQEEPPRIIQGGRHLRLGLMAEFMANRTKKEYGGIRAKK